MKNRSPLDSEGNGNSNEDLLIQIDELKNELIVQKRSHQLEMQKGLEAMERMQKASGSAASQPDMLVSIDGHELSVTQRVAIFVDVQNMYYAARNLYQSKLEFSKLLRHLIRGRNLARALAYIVERPGMEQNKFIEVLRRNGYEVRKRVVGERNDSSNRGDWNIGIALDSLALSSKIDVAILVTGDGDFVPLVEKLSMEGVRVEIASFRETTSSELYTAADQVHVLDERVILSGVHFQPSMEDDEEVEEYEEEEELVPSRTRRPLRRARGPAEEDFDDEDDED
ncbi:MAG: NYN domain-containing protein [Planctomycetota bacterium]